MNKKFIIIFFHSIINCLKKYLDFKGRSNRAEFWSFFIFYYFIIVLSFSPFIFPIINHKLEILAINHYRPLDFYSEKFLFIGFIVALLFYTPYLAVKTRRLHDINQSGHWIVAFLFFQGFGRIVGEIGLFISSILYVIILILCLKAGDKKKNKYGKAK